MFAKSLVGRFDVGPLKTRIGIVVRGVAYGIRRLLKNRQCRNFWETAETSAPLQAYAASVYYTQDVTECYDVNCLYAKIDALSYPAVSVDL